MKIERRNANNLYLHKTSQAWIAQGKIRQAESSALGSPKYRGMV